VRTAEFGTEGEVGGRLWVGSGGGGKVVGGIRWADLRCMRGDAHQEMRVSQRRSIARPPKNCRTTDNATTKRP
jgi:hypothetical protein